MAKLAVSVQAPVSQDETAYLSPKCEVVEAPEKGGHAVLAREPIGRDELIAMWPEGAVPVDEPTPVGRVLAQASTVGFRLPE